MLFSGILGLLQIIFLPGLLSLRLFRLKTGKLERFLYIFPLSLICNYLLVWLLTLLHLYSRPVLLGVILIEVLALVWFGRDALKQPVSAGIRRLSGSISAEFGNISLYLRESGVTGWLWAAAGIGTLSALTWALHLLRLNLGTVFTGWDTLLSWNKYAVDWAAGGFPVVHGMYPQLVPANWSISYVLLGTSEVQCFNTLLPPLFFLWILLMFFDLGYTRKEFGWFAGAVLCRYMMKKLMGDGLFDGYMDVPAACLTLLSVYVLLRNESRSESVLLSFVFACAAFVAKQAGWAAVVFFPVTVCCLVPGGFRNVSRRDRILIPVLFGLIVCPWYLRCFVLSRTLGPGQAEIVADGITIFNGKFNTSQKIELALKLLGKYAVFFLISLLGIFLVPKELRIPLLLYIWPQTVFWTLFFTYDVRNAAPVLPFVSAAVGLILSGAVALVLRLLKKLRAGGIPAAVPLLLGLILLAVGIGLYFRAEDLLESQRLKQRELFGARLNRELLYGVFGDTHDGNDILTDYPADYLSGYAECCRITDFSDAGSFSASVRDPQVRWVMIPQNLPETMSATAELLETMKNSGSLTEIRCSDGYFTPYCLYQLTDR